MHDSQAKGTTVKPKQRSAKTESARNGLLATLVTVLVFAGMLLLAVSSASASEVPRFAPEAAHVEVGSTRVLVEKLLNNGGLVVSWTAEYAAAEADGKAPPAGSPAWTVVDKGESREVSEYIYIGTKDKEPEGVLGIAPGTSLLRHLKPETAYFVRFTAKNADGEAVNEKGERSEMISFTTLPVEKPSFGIFKDTPPEVDVNRTDSTFEFYGKVETNGATTGYSVEYSLPEGGHAPAEHSASWKAFTSGASGSVTIAEDYAIIAGKIVGLTPETTYYVRVRASNEKGEIVITRFLVEAVFGSQTEFLDTLSAKPTVSLPSGFRNVTASGAQIAATSLYPHGSETVWRFEYATSVLGPWEDVPGAAGTISQAQAEAASYEGPFRVEAHLSGLNSAKVYYVRMFAENQAGEAVYCVREGVCEPASTSTKDIGSFETSGSPTATAFAVHGLHGESLRLLGAVDPKSAPTSAEQTITLAGVPTGGSFTLTFDGQTTVPIAFDATGEIVNYALGALSDVSGLGAVEGQAGGPYTVFFDNEASEPQIEADGLG